MEAVIGAVLGVIFIAAGFFAGWTVRDKVRGPDEPHLTVSDKPLPEPRDVPIAGRHVPKR